jgi:hypothetical protein
MWTQFFCSGEGQVAAVVNKVMNTKTVENVKMNFST